MDPGGAVGIKVRNRELGETLARRALAGHYQAFEPGITVITPSRDDYCYTRYDELDIRERLRRLVDPNDPTQ